MPPERGEIDDELDDLVVALETEPFAWPAYREAANALLAALKGIAEEHGMGHWSPLAVVAMAYEAKRSDPASDPDHLAALKALAEHLQHRRSKQARLN